MDLIHLYFEQQQQKKNSSVTYNLQMKFCYLLLS